MDNRIYIIDVTNRDGVQTSRLGLAKLEKTVLNILLNKMGVYQSEMGFPTTLHETNYINANLELARMDVIEPMILEGWVRAIEEDVSMALSKYGYVLEATPSPDTIHDKLILDRMLVAAPGVPLGISENGCQIMKDRLVHDKLELGVAAMAISLLS